jgi:hypothetical protein
MKMLQHRRGLINSINEYAVSGLDVVANEHHRRGPQFVVVVVFFYHRSAADERSLRLAIKTQLLLVHCQNANAVSV